MKKSFLLALTICFFFINSEVKAQLTAWNYTSDTWIVKVNDQQIIVPPMVSGQPVSYTLNSTCSPPPINYISYNFVATLQSNTGCYSKLAQNGNNIPHGGERDVTCAPDTTHISFKTYSYNIDGCITNASITFTN